MKNGVTFTTIISQREFKSGVWDPFHYRNVNSTSKLSDFVYIKRIQQKGNLKFLPFEPIEYKDIPRGNLIGFNLCPTLPETSSSSRALIVPENTLLFGTMRAYLGNVLVTPKSDWISKVNCWFAINSEFVIIRPNDGLVYFWWAFLKSPRFLATLPTGTGGTRPRSNSEQLGNTPILAPSLEQRTAINEELMILAQNHWAQINNLEAILHRTGLY